MATTYHKAPSSYAGLEGIQALLFDQAIELAGLHEAPKEPKGVTIGG